MRKILYQNCPKIGDLRTKRYFAIFPVTIGKERRWFEIVEIEQEFVSYWQGLEDGTVYFWENRRFLN